MTRYRKLAIKRRTRNKRSKNRRNSRYKRGGGGGVSEQQSVLPKLSSLTPRQRTMAPRQTLHRNSMGAHQRKTPIKYSIIDIPATLPHITTKAEFKKTEDMLIGILNTMIARPTHYAYKTGVPRIIELLILLRQKWWWLNETDQRTPKIDDAIHDARFWYSYHTREGTFENEQNFTSELETENEQNFTSELETENP